MNVIIFIFLISSVFSFGFSDEYSSLPPIYHLEDFPSCLEKDHLYCKTDISLRHDGYESNAVWTLINNSIQDPYKLNRNLIHRGICIPKRNAKDVNSVKEIAQQKIHEELKELNFSLFIEDIICTNDAEVKISLTEKIFWCGFVAYLFFILYATIKDVSKKGSDSDKNITTLFSLTSNWKKICNTKGNEDYNKLKSIQGLRAIIMMTILWIHSLLSFNLIYIANPEEIEWMFTFSLTNITFTLSYFIVQIFFFISCFLVTIQIYNFYEKHGHFSFKHVLIMIVNRFFRLAVCSTVIITIMRLDWMRLYDGPITFDNVVQFGQRPCKTNWLQTFFFINNYLVAQDICHGSSWSLSVDFQLYVITVITIYMILKFKWNEWKVISFLILVSVVLFGTIIYVYETDASVKLRTNDLRKYVFIRIYQMGILYFSTYSSWTTSLIAISFGIVYVRNKNSKSIDSKVISALWALLFLGLPPIAMFMGRYYYSGIAAAIVGPLLKPLFSIGFAIGILGMSHNIGGILKRFLENDYFAIMSNFSYSVYIFQSFTMFVKGVGSYSLMKIYVPYVAMFALFVDIPSSIAAGIIGSLLFEQPGINLQKLLLPQLPRATQQSQKEK